MPGRGTLIGVLIPSAAPIPLLPAQPVAAPRPFALEWTDRSAGGSVNREARLSLPGGLILITRFIAGKAPLTEHRYAFTDHLGLVRK